MASDKPSTIPPRPTNANAARSSHRSPSSSRRATRPTRGLRVAARATPTVTRSFVVELLDHHGAPNDEILARITPTERTSTAAIQHGFRFSDAFMDVVTDLLVDLARENDDNDEYD